MLTNIFKRPLLVKRKIEGERINHNWVEGGYEEFSILANVQPTQAEVLLTLPEGYRTVDCFTLYTNTELLTGVNNLNNPDVVIIYDRRFTVIKVERWGNTMLSHYEVIVVQEGSDVDK